MRKKERRIVKEALDNLPSGLCFFSEKGLVMLCNRQMHRLAFEITGRDIQCISEMQDLIEGRGVKTSRDGELFILQDGSAWRFEQKQIHLPDSADCTQVIASNVTRFYKNKKELEESGRRLEEAAARLRRLSADVLAVSREEEILRMKMRVHDDFGHAIIKTRLLLRENGPIDENIVSVWDNALLHLKNTDGAENRNVNDALIRLRESASQLGLCVSFAGPFPKDGEIAALFALAAEECVTNAVRHAGARHLYVKIMNSSRLWAAEITNDGAVPKKEIIEGGGLSSLRACIEKAGGSMLLRSLPYFQLNVYLLEKGDSENDQCIDR